ncbi:MAG: hypothetical protein PSV16_04220 [Flavobacterium sp.]|nr:hypothetical protein [Flavobacterium sp.]
MQKSFSIEHFKILITFLQVMTALIGTLYYYKYKNTFLIYFQALLWYTVLNDYCAVLYLEYVDKSSNVVLYNIYQIVRFSIVFMMYRNAIESSRNRKIIAVFLCLYLGAVIGNGFYEDFRQDYNVIPFIIGAIFIVISVSLYFSEILESHKIIFINKLLLFWISVALLVYFVPSIPFYVVRKYYVNSPTIPYIYFLNYFLVFTINLILIAGFIWSGKQQKA